MAFLTKAQIESAARGNQADTLTVLQAMHAQLENLQAATGISALKSTNGGQTAQTVPAAPSFTATGANGSVALTITPPALGVPAAVYYEVSYSASQTFSTGVTVMPTSSATTVNISVPGQTLFFRVRASLDQKTWSTYYALPSSVAAGLQTSAATSPNIPLNQSNFAVIDSIAVNGSVNVRIYGSAGGPGTPWVTAGGKVLPSATLAGQTPGSDAVVAYDPVAGMYQVKYRIADVFPDNWIVVGQVSIVGTTPPSLPTILPVIQNGAVVGYNVTKGGSGITANLTIVVADTPGGGTGATAGTQVIQGGVLKSVAPGNAGSGYGGGTTVTASGGVYSGASGGGGTSGGNGGRLTAITENP